MKGKIFLLLGIGFVPLALTAQTPYLYNKGLMSVVTSNSNNTALYIGGDFINESNGTDEGVMHLKTARVVLTGDLTRRGSASTNSHVFDVVETAKDETDSHLVFKGNKAQMVKSGVAYMDFAEKAKNAIYFPNIIVEKEGGKHVTFSPEIGASVYKVVPKTGRLILDSRKLNVTGAAGGDVIPGTIGSNTIHSNENSSILAHLLVKDSHDNSSSFTGEGPGKALDSYGGVQVNLALSAIDKDNRLWDGDAIVGMGIPFKKMYADYFMYNFLFTPSGNSIFNADGNTTTDPKTAMEPGKGYVVGIDLRGTDPNNYLDIDSYYNNKTNGYQLNFGQRVTEKYHFNRFAYGVNHNNLFQVDENYTSAADKPFNDGSVNVRPSTSTAYNEEVLNSEYVSRKLVAGFNYLSNPYTCPIDVSELLKNDGSAARDWEIVPRYTGSGAEQGEIANRVWVMDPSSAASGTSNFIAPAEKWPGNKWIVASYQYRLISAVGATNNPSYYDNGSGIQPPLDLDSKNSSRLIAPLQMFVVYANQAGVGRFIYIPGTARTVDNNALFLRSDKPDYEPDDFLFEVLDTKSGKVDRAAVVLRSFDEVGNYGNVKKLRTTVTTDPDGKTKAATSEGDMVPTYMSTLYTKGKDGVALESQFVTLNAGNTQSEVPLYLTPSLQEQPIEIRSFRNYTKKEISEIWLEDLQKNTKIKLSDGEIYKTTSKPTDSADRFKLIFKYAATSGSGDGDVTNPDSEIWANYSNSTLTVSGFREMDRGDLVSVYDIQGRLIKQATVDGSSVQFRDGFAVGAYIVKVTGHRSYVTKFLAR